MKIYGRIYKITNLINGKEYIGATKQKIKSRFNKHCYDAKNNYSLNMNIVSDIRKYGRKQFKIEEIDVAYSKKELKLIEGVYISWFKTLEPNGYNIIDIVNGKEKRSEKTKQKMKIAANKLERLMLLSNNGLKSRGKNRGGQSKYCGVCISKNRYTAQISFNKNRIYLGIYNTELDAAKAYDLKALELFGHDCNLNFPKLREKYLNNEIIINKSLKLINSKSGIKGVLFDKQKNKWYYKWVDNNNKNRTKTFKTKEETIKFKDTINNE